MTISKVTDYPGNKIYEDGILKRILTDNGYIEGNTYYFYIKDHLGNNRIVADASGSVVQSTQYYPFGMAFAESTNQGTQLYKYNGKELDQDHGLNWYDYEARYLTNDVPRFTTIDPLAEKYYSISPYAYVANSPMRYIDPTGMWIDDIYYNEAGKVVHRVQNDQPNKAFIIKTTHTTDELYPIKGPQKGISNPISSDAARTTEEQIADGNLSGDHMKNVLSLGLTSNLEAMVSAIKDDGTGGIETANNKEYSGNLGGKSGVYNTAESKSGKPSAGKNLVTVGNKQYHSHPSGTEKFKIGAKSYTGLATAPL